jgi:hypothetical protein
MGRTRGRLEISAFRGVDPANRKDVSLPLAYAGLLGSSGDSEEGSD